MYDELSTSRNGVVNYSSEFVMQLCLYVSLYGLEKVNAVGCKFRCWLDILHTRMLEDSIAVARYPGT